MLIRFCFMLGVCMHMLQPSLAQVCSVPACAEGETCYTTPDEGLSCLLSIPFNKV